MFAPFSKMFSREQCPFLPGLIILTIPKQVEERLESKNYQSFISLAVLRAKTPCSEAIRIAFV